MKNWQKSCMARKRSRGTVLLLLLALVFLSAAAGLYIGAVYVPPGEVLGVLLGRTEASTAARIILYARLPRVCGGLLAGAALAVSGAVIQSVLANPLAAPNIIGVNSGAGLAVAVCCAVAPGCVRLLPLASFMGAMLGLGLVLFIARRTGAARITLVLAGMAISSIFSAAIDAVITFVPTALNGYSDFRIGGLANLSMAELAPAALLILPALLVVFSLSHELDVLMLGSDLAQSLGLAVERVRLVLLAMAAALAGAAVSFSGLLGFVGLLVPHIMRKIVGGECRWLLPACALGGAAFLTLCDLLARTLFAPYDLPVGIVLSLLGGPFFICMLLRQRGGRTHD